MSNFEKVINFNSTFGVLKATSIDELRTQTKIFTQDPQTILSCMKLIRSECQELEDAVKSHDFIETVDALVDIIYVVYGMGSRIGVNMDKAFDIVHANNMSKLCKTEAEAQQTVQHYKDNITEYDSPTYRQHGDNWVVYNASTNKVLKSINWKEVDLRPVIN